MSITSLSSLSLNRALEEVERYKVLARDRADSGVVTSSQQDAGTQRLLMENKQLQRQKTELLGAFKKQLKLIDILKRQKVLNLCKT